MVVAWIVVFRLNAALTAALYTLSLHDALPIFWTSLLVGTAAWVVLLQGQGLVNNALAAMGVIDHAHRGERVVDEALPLEQHHPCRGADEERRPEDRKSVV